MHVHEYICPITNADGSHPVHTIPCDCQPLQACLVAQDPPRIIDYTIAAGVNPRELKATVRRMITEGWQPIGGFIDASSEEKLVAQTLVKYARPDLSPIAPQATGEAPAQEGSHP